MSLLVKSIRQRYEGNTLHLLDYKTGAIASLSGHHLNDFRKIINSKIPNPEVKLSEHKELKKILFEAGMLKGEKPISNPALDKPIFTQSSLFSPFVVLWSLTYKCNYNCVYCHAKADGKSKKEDLCLVELELIADKIAEANVWQVVITGGEALLRGDETFSIIERLKNHKIWVALISNGSSLTEENLHKIKELNMSLGISIDTYSADKQAVTRGKNAFKNAVNGIERCIKHNISFNVLCTLTRHNYDDLERYLSFLKNIGVTSVAIQNLIPGDDINLYNHLRLTSEQERKLASKIENINNNNHSLNINFTEVDTFTILKKLSTEANETTLMGKTCSACSRGLYIDASGSAYPCTSLRQLPLGNLIKTESLSSLWMTSPNAAFVRNLRNKTTHDMPACKGCEYIGRCDGGCRGEAHTIDNDWFALHDRCPRKREYAL
jgi:radical SAM protein with 4Fe4S-binding SPASM domain